MRRIVLLLLTLLALPGAAAAAEAPDPFEALGLVRMDSGIRAPAFSVPDLHGKLVTVSAGPGPATILVFWATW
ncbi:MAG: hypothetical protein HY727_20120 [Candidatus Rokubacteria bacterium]|nr:hypothetical protein [Candidatus Rokubacteria bacterium]